VKRVWVAAAIFLFLLSLCSYGLVTTNQLTETMSGKLNEIKAEVKIGNKNTAIALSESVIKEWHEYHMKMCMYMPHTRLESIDQSLAALPPLISSNNGTDQFEAECEKASAQIEHLKDTEMPSLANIF
jgi:hypothetical protein